MGEIFSREGLKSLLLESERFRDIVIITAPAGSGKTTLINDYLKSFKKPSLWYTFREQDSDPVVFFNSFLREIRAKVSDFNFPSFNTNYLSEPALIAYAEKLFSRLPGSVENINLIFDDIYLLHDNSPVWRILEFLIKRKLYRRLFLISRKPIKVSADWESESRILRLGFEHLVFSSGEAESFLRSLSPELTKEEISEIHSSSGGLAAFLRIGAEIKRGVWREKDIPNYFELFSEKELRAFSKYAYTRVIDRNLLSEEDIPILIPLLERLADRYILVNRVGDRYIIHDLLRSFLKEQARDIYGDTYGKMLRDSVLKLSELGRVEEAIGCLIEAGDFKEAFGLLKRNFYALFFSEKYLSVISFLDALEPYFSKDPWFMCFRGACIKLKNPFEAIELLEEAYYLFKREGITEGMKLALANIFNAIQYQGEDFRRASRYLDEFERMRVQPNSMVDILLISYAGILYMLGRGESGRSAELLKEGIKSITPEKRFYQLLSYLYIYLTIALNSSGKPLEAEEYYIKAEEIYRETPENPAGKAMYEFFASFHHIFRGNFDTAVERLEEALRYSLSWGLRIPASHISYKLLEAYLGRGDTKKANRLIDKIQKEIKEWSSFSKGMFYQLLAQKYLMEGNLPQALAHSERALGILEGVGGYIFYRRTRALNAWIRGLEGNLGEAERVLMEIERDADRDGAVMQRVTALIYLSHLNRYINPMKARRHLSEALKLAKERGIRSFYNFYPQLMAEVCGFALREGIEREFVKELIAFYRLSPPKDAMGRMFWNWEVRIFGFGGLRIEVKGNELTPQDIGGKKPLQILCGLMVMGGNNVEAVRFKNFLWTTAREDKFMKNLEFNVRRLRKEFSKRGVEEQVILWKSGLLSLNQNVVWSDVVEAYRLLEHVKNYSMSQQEEQEIEAIKAFVRIYRGKLLPEFGDEWVQEYRDYFHTAFKELSERLMVYFLKNRLWEDILVYSTLITQIEPDVEIAKEARNRALSFTTGAL